MEDKGLGVSRTEKNSVVITLMALLLRFLISMALGFRLSEIQLGLNYKEEKLIPFQSVINAGDKGVSQSNDIMMENACKWERIWWIWWRI